jgi:O-antigen/teichoic acid export membrane protein
MSGFKIKNVFFAWGGLICTVLYGFFMTPFIVHRLGDTNYGLWNLIMTCVGYMALLDFGIQSSVNRYIAKHKGAGDMEGVNRIYTNALAIYSFIAVLVAVAGCLIAFRVDTFFKIAPEDVQTVRTVMIIMSLYAALEFPLNVYGSVIYAYQRFDVLNITTAASLAVQAFLYVYFLNKGASLFLFAAIVISVGLMKYAAQFTACRIIVREIRFVPAYVSSATLKTIFRYSVVTFAAIVANSVIFRTDNIVIGVYLDPKAITIYSIGFMMSEYLAQFVGKIGNTLTPLFSEHESRGEVEESKTLLIQSSRFSTLIGVPMGLTVLVLGRSFIDLWIGKEYEGAYEIMAILLCARMCGFPTSTMYSMLYGVGKHHIVLFTGLVEAVLNLGLSLYLVKKIGIAGVAWGTLIPMIIGNILFVLVASRRVGISAFEWVGKGMLRALVFSGVFYAAAFYLCSIIDEVSWTMLTVETCMVGLLYAILIVSFGLRRDERARLQASLSRRFLASRVKTLPGDSARQ